MSHNSGKQQLMTSNLMSALELQPSYWRGEASDTDETMLHIHLNPALMRQVAQTAGIDSIDLVNCFSKPDLRLHQIAKRRCSIG